MKTPIILPLFLIWYTIGFMLQVFFTVPEDLAFSKPIFLILYGLSMIEFLWRYQRRDRRLLIGLGIVALSTFFIEVLSVETGFPFGDYDYYSTLGPRILGVPFTIALAWVGVLLNALLLSSQQNKWLRALETGFWIVIMDLILDPVAVFEHYWVWSQPGSFSYFGIPITNFISWFIVGALLSLLFPLYKRSAQMHRAVIFVFQLMLFLFGMLSVRHGEFIIGAMSLSFIALVEGKFRYAIRK